MVKQHNFSMVEILLALGVIAIGVCSIMVLFPIGSSATRDAIMEQYAANAADQLLHYIKYELSQPGNWDSYIKPDNPGNGFIPTEKTTLASAETSLENLTASSNWDKIDNFESIYKHRSKKGVFQIISHRNPSSTDFGTPAFEEKVDFRGIMYIWKEKIDIDSHEIDYVISASLKAEIQWPAELPEGARQKSSYVLEVYKSN